ncbi:RHS repeat-associated core domain-containing protein [uncultured Clostridium sp.]|uniref:RHS repeat-associated core domain-containing protein n=1 Tax=uncultured Clostridium sp. TaxID=59620 RepID=UPI003217F4DC
MTGDKALGEKNPYRYRGYRYDTETGYYYLQSRYYNPEIGKFINADALGGNVGALLSHNIFAYCNNNPVNATDPNGFRLIYTMGEETAAMRDALYKVMAKAASVISRNNSSNKVGNTVISQLLNIGTTYINSNHFKINIKEADDIYKSLKGVSSGAPKLMSFLGGGLQKYSYFMDIKSFATEKSWFKRQFSAVSLGSAALPQPWGAIVGIGSGGLKDAYEYMPENIQIMVDWACQPIISAPSVRVD